ncbi:MAG: sugar transferase [bacterium]|nr:sugar transferase [bacterium]
MESFYRRKGKRILDITLSIIGLIIFLPLMGIIGVLIKLSSWHDPVIFRQVRVGKNGEFFTLCKFRTMRNGAEVKEHPNGNEDVIIEATLTHNGDKRVTFLGKILRKTAMDEFPQLFNVLRGDMSIVCPRPERPIFYPKYKDILKNRIVVKPGLFCLVELKYGTSDYNGNGNGGINLNSEEGQRERMKLDMEYIERCSFRFDLWLIIKMTWKLLLREYYFSKIFMDKKNGNGNGHHHKTEITEYKYIWSEEETLQIPPQKMEKCPICLKKGDN